MTSDGCCKTCECIKSLIPYSNTVRFSPACSPVSACTESLQFPQTGRLLTAAELFCTSQLKLKICLILPMGTLKFFDVHFCVFK